MSSSNTVKNLLTHIVQIGHQVAFILSSENRWYVRKSGWHTKTPRRWQRRKRERPFESHKEKNTWNVFVYDLVQIRFFFFCNRITSEERDTSKFTTVSFNASPKRPLEFRSRCCPRHLGSDLCPSRRAGLRVTMTMRMRFTVQPCRIASDVDFALLLLPSTVAAIVLDLSLQRKCI